MTEASDLDALIVKHIGDLEAARRRIDEVVDPRLLREVSVIMENWAAGLGWVHKFEDDEQSISVAPEDWIKRDKDGKINWWFPWFELSSIDADGDLVSASHLAEFLALEDSSTCKALSFCQDVLGKKVWRNLLKKTAKEMQALRDLGFEVDDREGLVNFPVRLDLEVLKTSFEENDFEEALAPVSAALDRVRQAMPHFQLLALAAERLRNEG